MISNNLCQMTMHSKMSFYFILQNQIAPDIEDMYWKTATR